MKEFSSSPGLHSAPLGPPTGEKGEPEIKWVSEGTTFYLLVFDRAVKTLESGPDPIHQPNMAQNSNSSPMCPIKKLTQAHQL